MGEWMVECWWVVVGGWVGGTLLTHAWAVAMGSVWVWAGVQIKDLRSVRLQYQELESSYTMAKTTYDNAAAGLEAERLRLEQECNHLQVWGASAYWASGAVGRGAYWASGAVGRIGRVGCGAY